MNYSEEGVVANPPAGPTGSRGDSMFVLIEAARKIQERLEGALEAVGLSSAKYMALQALVQAGEPITLGELACSLRCVRSNITQLVDRLEAEGFVRRVSDATDRRAVRAVVTEVGAEKQAAGAEAIERLQREIAVRIAPEDREVIRRVLCTLT